MDNYGFIMVGMAGFYFSSSFRF